MRSADASDGGAFRAPRRARSRCVPIASRWSSSIVVAVRMPPSSRASAEDWKARGSRRENKDRSSSAVQQVAAETRDAL